MTEALDKLANVYADNNAVRVLVEVASIATGGVIGAVDAGLVALIDDFKAKRLRAFFDELATGRLELTDEVIESDAFLHSYFSTLNAVLRARHQSRAALYARLLKGAVRREELGDPFGELLEVLASLSDRELCCLTELRRFEDAHAAEVDSRGEPGMAAAFWPAFLQTLDLVCGVPPGEVDPFVTRLLRTGTYQMHNVWGGVDNSQPAKTSSLFTAITELLAAGTD